MSYMERDSDVDRVFESYKYDSDADEIETHRVRSPVLGCQSSLESRRTYTIDYLRVYCDTYLQAIESSKKLVGSTKMLDYVTYITYLQIIY